MITLALLFVLLVTVVIAAVILLAGGGLLAIVFSDVIIWVLFIVWLIRRIGKKRKK